MFADISQAPDVQSLARRLEHGGALSCTGIGAPAQPFLAALLQKIFPHRPIIAITTDLKTQESFQQDLETWLPQLPTSNSQLLFYPAWEILPHEDRLPHADVISDRLQTLASLSEDLKLKTQNSKLIVASVTALLQKTFPPGEIQNRTRTLARGDKIAPLDLIEQLEDQGYQPEAQVSQKGEIALRGGIVDVWPLTSPWPARLEFFGDELESLREFDPLTQISRGEILSVTLPPAGELGILKQRQNEGGRAENETALATLLDYLPPETIFLLCEPEQLALRANEYALQIPAGDPFFISWPDLLAELNRRGFTAVALNEAAETGGDNPQSAIRNSPRSTPTVRSPSARRKRQSPRRSAVNFSIKCTAGCARTTPSMSFATTMANGNGLRKSGRNSMK